MSFNRPLRLTVARKENFATPVRAVLLLALLAAILSPQPVSLSLLAIFIIGAGWVSPILDFYKVSEVELALVLFADGRVRLDTADDNVVEGFLSGQQWCTQRVAVLRASTAGEARYLLILPGQQDANAFRRLNAWLRQGTTDADMLLKSEGSV